MKTGRSSVQRITCIQQGSLLTRNEALAYAYKYLPLKLKWDKEMNRERLKEYVLSCEQIYHPFWIAKTLVIAERPPFPPKKMPNVIFVDAVYGYRGLFGKVPPLEESDVRKDQLVPEKIHDQDDALRYVKHVQHRQMNRSYLLKKPIHQIQEMFVAYVPLWNIHVKVRNHDAIYMINANTGERERFCRQGQLLDA